MNSKRTIWVLITIFFVLSGILAGAGYVVNALYWHPQDRAWTRSLIAHAHLPIARVDGMFVSYAEYLIQQDAARRFLVSEAANNTPTADGQILPTSLDAQANKAILDQLIRATAVKQMGDTANIHLSDADVNTSFDALIARAGTSTDPGEIDAYLKDAFGWTRDDFKQRVVRPAILETAIRQEVYANDDTKFQAALTEKANRAKIYIRL